MVHTPVGVTLTGTGVTSTTNLAAGATMSASSSNGGFPASATNDGNTASYWESGAVPAWLQDDLGSAQQVGSLVLDLPPSAAWGARTQTLSVQGSTDGGTWTTLKASAGYVFDPATGNTVTITVPTATVRYLRLTITANTGWSAAQFSELQIFS